MRNEYSKYIISLFYIREDNNFAYIYRQTILNTLYSVRYEHYIAAIYRYNFLLTSLGEKHTCQIVILK